ncbi:MAG: GFA family protein [Pseudomonadota bacterium]
MITGRCYCGATTLSADASPFIVSYCHCEDCRRWTGAPLPAFVALPMGALKLTPEPEPFSAVPGVKRWVCGVCGSPMAAHFDYLPDQIYVPIGVVDQAATLAPELHSHAHATLPWLHVADDLPRHSGSARDALNASSDEP